jgi:putative iron-only hydrogenase system regulator
MLGMEKRVALLSIIVDEKDSVEKLNALLHEYGEFIIGRMGIPYKKREINIISIAMDAPQDTTSELAGKIGKLEGVNVKTSFSGVISNDE